MSDPRVMLAIVCMLMFAVTVGAIWLVRRCFAAWLERNGYIKK